MLVLVTGGSGFVGNQVVSELIARGHRVRCLLRPGSEKKLAALNQVEVAPGDVMHPDTVAEAVRNCDAVIHLVGIIREFPGRGVTFERLHCDATAHVVEAAKAAGAHRYLHMSALGARPEPANPYHTTNYRADEYVMGSGLTYTIFRPSIIYGPADQSINLFVRQIRRYRVVPIIGDGLYELQPVPVWTVAQAYALALEKPATENRLYDVGGPEPLSFNAVIDTLAQVLNRWVYKMHLSAATMRRVAGCLGRYAWFPLTPGQIEMLLEGSTCDPTAFYQDFGLEPVSFQDGLARYLP